MFDHEGFHDDRLEAAADREIRALEREIRKLEQENQELRGGLVGNDEGLERYRKRLEWCRQHNEKHKRELDHARQRIAELEAALTKVENDVLYWQGRAAETEDERDELQGAIVPILYYFIEAVSGEFWVESEAMLDKHGGRGTAQLKRDLKAAYDLLAEILEEEANDG